MDERTLLRQAGMKGKKAKRHEVEREELPDREEFTFGLEEYCLSALLKRPYLLHSLDEVLRDVGADGLNADDFVQAENREIFASWLESMGLKEGSDLECLQEELDPMLHLRFDLLLEGPRGAPPLDEDKAEKALIEGALRLRQRKLQRLVEELRFLQADAEEPGGGTVEEYGQMVDLYLSALRGIYQALAARSLIGRREAALKGVPGLVT